MKGAFDRVPKPADATTSALRRMLMGAESTKGPVSSLVERLGGMKGLLGTGIIAAGLGAAAAGLSAVAVAAGAAAVAVAAYGIAAADARRSELLQLEGLSKYRHYWLEMVTGQRRAADSAGFMQTAIDQVAAKTPLARSRIAELQAELSRAGLRSGNLTAALDSLAMVESAQGQSAAQAFKTSLLSAQLYGTSIKKLSDDVKKRLGGVVRGQMLSLDVQQRKLRESVSMLFADVKIEPLLQQLSNLTSMFSESTATGRALKSLVDGLVSPLIGSLSSAGPLVKRFFQGFVIAALVTTIAVLKARNALRDMFGGSELFGQLDALKVGVSLGAFAFGTLATAVGIVVGGLALLGGMAAAAAYGIYKLAEPFIWAARKGAEFTAWIVSTDWISLGMSIPSGIAKGITSGAGAVFDAIKNLGSSAINAFQKRLEINSPSRLAAKVSLNVPRGISAGIDAGRGMVQVSAERMGAATERGMRDGMSDTSRSGGAAERAAQRPAWANLPPMPEQQLAAVPVPQPRAAAAPARAGASVTIGDIHLHGVKDADDAAQRIRQVVEEVLEGAAVQMGGA